MFEDSFMQVALIVGTLAAGLCAYLGNFILLKKMTFISIALAEIAALGVALGFLLNISPNTVSLMATILGILFFWFRSKKLTTPHESIIGLIYAVSAALGILLIARNPLMESTGIDLISGNLLYCNYADIWNMVIIVIIISIVHIIFYKEFIFISFDRETAQAEGLKTGFYDFVLMLTIGLCISFCMKLTGVLFVFASMIIPGLITLNLFKKVSYIIFSSIIIAAICVVLGISASYKFDLPTSPSIICFYGIFYLFSQIGKKLSI